MKSPTKTKMTTKAETCPMVKKEGMTTSNVVRTELKKVLILSYGSAIKYLRDRPLVFGPTDFGGWSYKLTPVCHFGPPFPTGRVL